ncbi:CDP-alcohol phosphatidyltransferase family protein [Parasphingorhabdus flavimaris]|uniref:CDP-alcohol phosphatidyltransferase family protein n=1 Tax=Parasphingorhabdus flavimaris TaxID=266812 RepID=A0ABX2N463_9SPHN|nr:CDP-alcohol phosphatidyltransferase family protein [Parasphingorhabdus flavimaris]NVD28505.1 CDP-alcohol phosphatidyltransferase family protein [Parasphingorhabdus flavimaris]|tara:strand:+ start:6880 stop:7482 length:603 start_codon:yes stop_codon:yes gene_type:complete
MLDSRLRPIIDPPLDALGARLARIGLTANQVTLAGGAVGIAAGVAIGYQHYLIGLALLLFSRLFDGLDGAIARATRQTDFGGYLDIVSDFAFYIAVPIGFGFAASANLPFALILVGSFTLTGISFLAYAVMAAKQGRETEAHGKKSFFYNSGLAEGTETITAFVLMCLMPQYFTIIAAIYSAMCVVTVFQRTLAAKADFS